MSQTVITPRESKLYNIALALSVFTIVYNMGEGVLATFFGNKDNTLALFGFGLDSFIETISAIGITHMILRMINRPDGGRDRFEITALTITGWAFYGLCVVLTVLMVLNFINGSQPKTTFWGVVISSVSILFMWALIYAKTRIGKELKSAPIIADANCAKVCVYMSVILLVSSAAYEFLSLPYVDAIGTAGIIWFSYKEGGECFQKAKGIACSDGCGH
jgi:divalent metal cation (Fe/Co/Zn/Cd) transporter